MQKKPLYTIMAVIFTNILGAGMVMPILPLYAVDQFGATDFQAALLTTAFFVGQFLAAPVLGQLSDKVGRRPVLLVSQVGTFLSFILFLFAGEIGELLDVSGVSIGITGGLLMMFVARSLDGITGGNITAAQAYISDISTTKERTQALGLLAAAMSAGFVFGPGLGGLLAGIDIRMPFITAAIITLATLTLTFFALEESLPPEKRAQKNANNEEPAFSLVKTFKNRNLLLIIFLGFLMFSAFSALPPVFALYVDRMILPEVNSTALVVQQVGIIFAITSIFTILTQTLLLRPMLKRFGEQRMILIGFTTWASGMFFFPLLTEVWMLALGMFPYAFSRGIIDPSLQSLVTRFSSPQTRGRVLGVYQSVQSLAMIFGPIWAGWVFTHVSPGSVFTISGSILTVAWGFAWVLQRVKVEEESVGG